MKIRIDIKDPDGFYESMRDQAITKLRENGHEDLYRQSFDNKCAKKEFNELVEEERQEIESALEKWVRFGECCTLEFDTETGTAVVVPVR